MKNFYKSGVLYFEEKKAIEGNVIKDVAIAMSGKTKDTRFLKSEFITALVTMGNEQEVGVKARFGHPNMCATTLGTYIGRYKNFRLVELEEGQNKAIADLHLDEIAKESPNGDLYSYVLNMAENNPDMFGNSIEIDVEEWEEIEIDDTKWESPILKSFVASAVVDNPTATNNLFSMNEDLGLALTQFLDDNPTVFEVLQDEKLTKSFLNKYENYLKLKGEDNMTLFDKVKESLLGKKSFELILTDATGEQITVDTDNEDVAVGDVVTKDGAPLTDGEYILSDGRTLVIIEGKVSEIMPKAEASVEETTSEETTSEMAKRQDTIEEQVLSIAKNVTEAFSKISDIEKSLTFMADNISSKSFSEKKEENIGDEEGKIKGLKLIKRKEK